MKISNLLLNGLLNLIIANKMLKYQLSRGTKVNLEV